jgi:hypothetical protein
VVSFFSREPGVLHTSGFSIDFPAHIDYALSGGKKPSAILNGLTMQVKELRRHLFCQVELNYYSDGTIALECVTCGKTLLLFCGGDCGNLVFKTIAFESRPPRKPKPRKKVRKRSKEFQQRVKALCDYHNSCQTKPLDFDKPDFRDLKNLSDSD